MFSLYGTRYNSYNGTCRGSYIMNLDNIAVVVASIIAVMILVSIIKDKQ